MIAMMGSLRRNFVTVLGVMLAVGWVSTVPAAAAYLRPSACTLIDTDFDIDDMMAIPLVIGNRYVAGIVTSEGYTMPSTGGAALSRLISEPGQRHIPVIVGAASNLPHSEIVEKWGQFVLDYRAMMDKAFTLLSAPLHPARRGNKNYTEQIAEALKDCRSVDILIIGAFTSFVEYSSRIRPKIRNVVIMGKPLSGDSSQTPGNFTFNCEYDMKACKTAFKTQLPGLNYFYVDPPRTSFDKDPVGREATVYGPTLAMVDALGDRGLPYTLKQALTGIVRDGSLGSAVNGPDYWAIDCCFRAGGASLLWDQSAALFLLHADLFRKVGGAGGHYEPTISPSALRELWTDDTNRSVNYVEKMGLR